MRALTLAMFCLSVALCLTLASTTSQRATAATENWSEVVRFTGTAGIKNTTAFAIGHVAWRIRWSFTYASGFESIAGLVVFTYPQGETHDYIDMILAIGSSQATGTQYIYNHTGTFYMNIAAPDNAVTSYIIIVEQDLNSVPEFSISTVTLLLLFGATLAAVIARRGKRASLQRPSSANASTIHLRTYPC